MTTHEFNNLQKGLQKYAKDITDSVLGGVPVPVTAPKPMAIGGFSGSTSPPVVQQNNNIAAPAGSAPPTAQPSVVSAPPASTAPAVTPPVAAQSVAAQPPSPVAANVSAQAQQQINTTPNPNGGFSPAQQPLPSASPAEPPASFPPLVPAPQPAATQAPNTPKQLAITGAGTADKAFAPLMTKMRNATTPQQKQALQQEVSSTFKQHMAENPIYQQGIADMQAGKNDTEGAKALQGNMDKYKDTQVYEEFEKLKRAHPEANLSDHKTYASFLSQASNTAMTKFNEMPMEQKLLTGLGLGGGLIGILSSMFGEGGMTGGLLGMLGLAVGGAAGAAGGMFGDDARRMVGQGAMNVAGFFGQNVPTAQSVTGALNGGGGSAVQSVMDAKNEQGQAGGWTAGQAEIDKYKGQLGTLTGMGRGMGTTMLMGLPGEGAPQTADAAGQMYDQLAAKQQELADPNYLYNQALTQATEQAKTRVGGILPDLGRFRGLIGQPDLGTSLGIPAGVTPEEMARAELIKRYGEFPMQNKTSALVQNLLHKFAMQQLVTKAARCWAGYEPVPGKAPYSDNSCRPKRKKKAEKKAEQYSGQPFNQAIGY